MESTNQLLFVRIPKNASTSIYQHLGEKNIVNKEREKFALNSSKPLYAGFFDTTHALPTEICAVIPNADEYLSFAVIRNPWDRMVSIFLYARKRNLWGFCGLKEEPSLENFCKIAQKRQNDGNLDFYPSIPQTTWLNGSLKIKEILFFENLKEDFKSFLNKYGIEDVSPNLPWLNSSKRSDHYRSFFSEKARQIVQNVYDEDLKTFDYKF